LNNKEENCPKSCQGAENLEATYFNSMAVQFWERRHITNAYRNISAGAIELAPG
jgi:hypothetical protein